MDNPYPEHAAWIELSAKAFKNNVNIYRNVLGSGTLLGSVLKGNAYGHGFQESLSILHPLVDLIFVISPIDAYKIRKYEALNSMAQKRVVVLGPISAHEALLCAQQEIEVTIADASWESLILETQAWAAERSSEFKKLKGHIHVDTGLGREGFTLDGLDKKVEFLKKLSPWLHVQGVMTHFSNVEDVTTQDYALGQVDGLNAAHNLISKTLNVPYKLEKHAAQSAASLILNSSHADLVRAGIGLYGLWPSRETKLSAVVVLQHTPKLQPALSWKCRSQSIKWVPAGSYIGYGCSFRAERSLRIGLFPVGYFDGYPRLMSGNAHVLVNGHRCKILGRVMMNHIIVDLTDATSDESPVVATLLGRDGGENISAELLAEWAQTINYEIVARIGAHLKRLVVDS